MILMICRTEILVYKFFILSKFLAGQLCNMFVCFDVNRLIYKYIYPLYQYIMNKIMFIIYKIIANLTVDDKYLIVLSLFIIPC